MASDAAPIPLPGLRRRETSEVVNIWPGRPNELVFDASGAHVVDGSGGICTIAVDCNLEADLYILRLLEGTCQLVTSAPRVLAQHVPYQLILKNGVSCARLSIGRASYELVCDSAACALPAGQAEALEREQRTRSTENQKCDTETIAGEDDDESGTESIDILAVRASTSPAADTSCAPTPSLVRTAASAPAPIPAPVPTSDSASAPMPTSAAVSTPASACVSTEEYEQQEEESDGSATECNTDNEEDNGSGTAEASGHLSPNCASAPDVLAVSSSPVTPERQEAAKMLQAMGFPSMVANLQALAAAKGDVGRAIDWLSSREEKTQALRSRSTNTSQAGARKHKAARRLKQSKQPAQRMSKRLRRMK